MHRTLVHAPSKLQRLLRVCTRRSEICQIHAFMIKTGLDTVPFPISKLLASCVMIDFAYARSVFERTMNPNLFMFNTMLRGHSMCERPDIGEVVCLFDTVRARGISLDQFSFIASVKSCAGRLNLKTGQQFHGLAIRSGFCLFLNVRNVLISFYIFCGMVDHGQHVFDEVPHRRDVVTWGALISGYLELCQYSEVLELLMAMRSDGLDMTPSVVVSVLLACSNLMDHNLGGSLHGYCIKAGFSLDSKVATSLLTMYGKFQSLDTAWLIFLETPWKDVVLWNCMVDAYVRCGLMEQSLDLLEQMKVEGLKLSAATLVGMLSVCASSGKLVLGQRLHNYVDEEMEKADVVLGTALIDMYSKCGSVDKATEIFEKMKNKDVKTWTAMVAGLGINGRPKGALQLFYQMEEQGVRPNDVTFLAVLSACCHGGFVVAGEECFKRMIEKYHCSPRMEHYGCIVDLLARSGMLQEAHELIKSLPIERDPMAWRAFLSACRVHGNVEFAELAEKTLIALGGEHPTDALLLSGTYAAAGRLTDVAVVSERLKKVVGWSSVVSDG